MARLANVDQGRGAISATVRTVCDWYHIRPEFAHAVLETYVGPEYARDIAEIHELLNRYAALRIQLEYAFSTVVRGEALARQLRSWGLQIGQGMDGRKSYLDVGCAYGGFLITFARLGYDVVGIEIDEKFERLGRVNLAASDHAATVLRGDFLSSDPLPDDARFDLITCNDVIEHVTDPEECMRKICRILKPGGAAYVASPNKLSIRNINADVHFQRFGLTLLDYFRARAAYVMYSDYPYYTVSDFFEPEWYVNTAKASGAQAEIVYEEPANEYDVPQEIATLYGAFSEWIRLGAKKLDALMRREITREFAEYSVRMFRAYSEHVRCNSMNEFTRRWVDPLTRILITKPSEMSGR